ncbi:Peroxidase 1 [Dichanthelium oligosanthes]|uniref:Peroxidase n=1 Tax=Dichanthelium oligosanthes TaxID=888268 RepID=A0A1E5UIE0_9POAL|nr:Peroxidase 1 [Dichanthelium oligosanthes]
MESWLGSSKKRTKIASPPSLHSLQVLLTMNPGGGQTEHEAGTNSPSLRGFDVIDVAKAAVERSCPCTVSCTDIVAFAARDSISLTGSVLYQVPTGRRNGRMSNAMEASANLPPFFFTAKQLTNRFAEKGLSMEEMVVLSGAHTVDRSFCSSFVDRVWDQSVKPPKPKVDAGLSSSYADLLRALCPSDTMPATLITTAMDPGTPNVLDNNYYKFLPRGMGLFFSDNQLRVDPQMAALVSSFVANQTLWKEKFAVTMVKMGRIQVQTGTCGEVRLNCSVVNLTSSSIELGSSTAPAVDEDGIATS